MDPSCSKTTLITLQIRNTQDNDSVENPCFLYKMVVSNTSAASKTPITFLYNPGLLSQSFRGAFAVCILAFAEGVVLCGAFAAAFAAIRFRLGNSIGILYNKVIDLYKLLAGWLACCGCLHKNMVTHINNTTCTRNSTFAKAFATLFFWGSFAGLSRTFRDLRFGFRETT